MKNNFNKKVIFLFIFMLIMIAMTFYILLKSKKENASLSDTDQGVVTSVKTIDEKQKKIEGLLGEINDIFSSENFDQYTKNLEKPKIDLPIEVGNVYNSQPFGSYDMDKE